MTAKLFLWLLTPSHGFFSLSTFIAPISTNGDNLKVSNVDILTTYALI
jgi:hypothetical protein